MSNYFKEFPKVFYKFGSNEEPVYFQKLSKYVDIVDTLKDRISVYIEYEIRDFDRPDNLSNRLYGTPEYDWTFFLMNDRLRETGWPMTQQDLYTFAIGTAYNGYVASFDALTPDSVASYASLISVDDSVVMSGGLTATVSKLDLDNNQIYLKSNYDITTGSSTMSFGDSMSVSLSDVVYEYNAVHHYVNDSGEWVDFFVGEEDKAPVTNLEHLINENDKSKRIRLIKKESIESVVSEFKRFLASN